MIIPTPSTSIVIPFSRVFHRPSSKPFYQDQWYKKIFCLFPSFKFSGVTPEYGRISKVIFFRWYLIPYWKKVISRHIFLIGSLYIPLLSVMHRPCSDTNWRWEKYTRGWGVELCFNFLSLHLIRVQNLNWCSDFDYFLAAEC